METAMSGGVEVVYADCLEEMRTMKDGWVDSVITDPPYGLSFMGRRWDTFGRGATPHDSMAAYQEKMTPVFAEALRVCKPGAHLLCFGGTRTFHRMACAAEDAGWEVRDCIMWVYGSGFPKSMDVSKQLAKLGDLRAEEWRGWGTRLKPAWEPIVVARKPLEGTVAANVLAHGTGALNLEACRVPCERAGVRGRFPANLAHDGSPEVLSLFPESKGQQGALRGTEPSRTGEHGIYGRFKEGRTPCRPRGDSGSAARFFYCAKASRRERGEGNDHPTVKPLALMEWLVKMATREGQLVLDPFAGSGTTLLACASLGRRCIGIERDPHYCEIARARLAEAGWARR